MKIETQALILSTVLVVVGLGTVNSWLVAAGIILSAGVGVRAILSKD